ncbi:MAG: B12-binding domain-containing radical SAM protein, partial [Treponema sp.]|nr:B12-binding domain-containing radical SAM protein [Treponema sp.]
MAAIVLSTINAKWIHPSLALRLLKANLPPDQDCVILEFSLRQNLNEKITAIIMEKPKILALSVSIWNHQATVELLRALEAEWDKRGPMPTVILGGPEITGIGEPAVGQNETPEIFRLADYIILGEGEAVFADLCRAVLEDPGGTKKQYSKFINAPPVNLGKIKNPYDLYTQEDLQHKLIYVE